MQNYRNYDIMQDASQFQTSQTFRFGDIGKNLNAYMTKICERTKYAIFRLYLTTNAIKTVYEILQYTIDIIWWLKEYIEGPYLFGVLQVCPKRLTESQ